MQQFQITVDGVGQVLYHENPNAGRLIMRIGADGIVRVTLPYGALRLPLCETVVRGFVNDNIGYITHLRNELRKAQNANSFFPDTPFKTRSHTLRMMPTSTDGKIHATIGNEWISLVYYPDTDFSSLNLQKFIRKMIGVAYTKEARSSLPQRVMHWATKLNLHYSHVDLRDMTSRWGSCSSSGRICLNVQLMKLPERLVDLVILHELTHTIHPDHSPAFYADLNKFLDGNHDALRTELKSYSTIVTPKDSYPMT